MNRVLHAARARPFHEADNARVPARGNMGGWDQMRARLVGSEGQPMIYCFSHCSASIRTIPALQHDPAKMEDVNTESEDHAADEWRYACMSRPFHPKVVAIRPQVKVEMMTTKSKAPGDWKLY